MGVPGCGNGGVARACEAVTYVPLPVDNGCCGYVGLSGVQQVLRSKASVAVRVRRLLHTLSKSKRGERG